MNQFIILLLLLNQAFLAAFDFLAGFLADLAFATFLVFLAAPYLRVASIVLVFLDFFTFLNP